MASSCLARHTCRCGRGGWRARHAVVVRAGAAGIDADYAQDFGASAQFHNGLPLVKPPYGFLNAIDLNKAEIVWQIPFGDMPSIRSHPALKGVTNAFAPWNRVGA